MKRKRFMIFIRVATLTKVRHQVVHNGKVVLAMHFYVVPKVAHNGRKLLQLVQGRTKGNKERSYRYEDGSDHVHKSTHCDGLGGSVGSPFP